MVKTYSTHSVFMKTGYDFIILFVDEWKAVSSLTLFTSFSSHKNTVSNLFINEDGTKITSVGHDSKLKVFSLSQNKQIRSANIGNMPLSCCIQLPNENVLVIGSWDNQM